MNRALCKSLRQQIAVLVERRSSRSAAARRCSFILISAILALVTAADSPAWGKGLPQAAPGDVGMSADHLQRIDQVVSEGLDAKRMPGCVVAVGRQGKLVYLKAYGFRQVKPTKVPMTVDTVFDLASLTKPVATATSIMKLVENGRIRLHDRVADHLPEFGQNGKQNVRVIQLLTHQGGLLPDNSLKDYLDGEEEAWKKIYALNLQTEPGSRFIYTDVGFMVLGEIVHRVSGSDLHDFSRTQIFLPLGMNETGFLPPDELKQRAAVTEQRDKHWMQGEVHDPRAFYLGGIAGHAGLFSTAADLAVYANMMLGRGKHGNCRVLAPRTVTTMTRPYTVSSGMRGLGWDKRSGYSSNRGELFTDSAFGHGGFTGTAMWMDPELDLFVIFLSNRVHPNGKGSVNSLAGRIGTIAAASITDLTNQSASTASDYSDVICGIDVLVRDQFKLFSGKRVGLITNQTGISKTGEKTAQILQTASQVNLTALFSPEHGLDGKLDVAHIADSNDDATGLKVFSLYGETRKPTAESLRDVDILAYDIQDIGTRFYTYISTMKLAMESAAENDVQFVVLDRPNPIGGVSVAGPVLDEGRESFVACHALPVRHGMTVGELARLLKHELQLDVELHIVECEGWRRDQFFDQTGLVWINPSPNMRSPTQALLYPGLGLLETTNLSVGRGTDSPFEFLGAPWLDSQKLAKELNAAKLPGVTFVPVQFTPTSSKFAGQLCNGIRVVITDRRHFEPMLTGWEVARQLRTLFPNNWEIGAYDRLLGSKEVLAAVKAGRNARNRRDLRWPIDQVSRPTCTLPTLRLSRVEPGAVAGTSRRRFHASLPGRGGRCRDEQHGGHRPPPITTGPSGPTQHHRCWEGDRLVQNDAATGTRLLPQDPRGPGSTIVAFPLGHPATQHRCRFGNGR